MSIVARFAPASLTREQYDECSRRLEESGDWPTPDGLELHVLFGSEGDFRISEIWESPEKLQAFGEKLMPVLSDVGIDPGPDPEILEVQKLVKN